MNTKLLLHLAATCILCCLSFVAGAMCADEPERSAGDTAALKTNASESEPAIDAPPDSIEIPPGRPDWIGQKPDYSGSVHIYPVASGPYALERDAKRALDKELVKATSKYIADQLGPHASHAARYDAKTIKKRFVKSENVYQDVARYSVGPMHEVFARLEFGPEFRKELKARARNFEARNRLKETTAAAGGSLFLLATAFTFFRFRCRR